MKNKLELILFIVSYIVEALVVRIPLVLLGIVIHYPAWYLFSRKMDKPNKTTVDGIGYPQWFMYPWDNKLDGITWERDVLARYPNMQKKSEATKSFYWNALRNPIYGYCYWRGVDTKDIHSVHTVEFGERSSYSRIRLKNGRIRWYVRYKENSPIKGKRWDITFGLKTMGLVKVKEWLDSASYKERRTIDKDLGYYKGYGLDNYIYKYGYERQLSGTAVRLKSIK